VILDSRVTSAIPADKRQQIWLGRPSRPYSRVVFLHTWLPADVIPAGWNNWSDPRNERTAWYAEYEDLGPGARGAGRVSWSRQLSAAEAKAFEPRAFLAGSDGWDPVAAAARLP
jgi:pectinesterase